MSMGAGMGNRMFGKTTKKKASKKNYLGQEDQEPMNQHEFEELCYDATKRVDENLIKGNEKKV